MGGLKIKVILPLLIALLVGIGIVQSTITGIEVTEVGKQVIEIGKNRLPRALALGEMRLAHLDAQRGYALILGARQEAELNSATAVLMKARETRNAAFATYEKFITLPKTRELFNTLNGHIAEFRTLGDKVLALAKEGKDEEAADLYNGKMRDVALIADADMIALIKFNGEITENSIQKANQLVTTTELSTIGLATLSILLGMLAAYIAMVRVARPITHITGSMSRLAGGDNTSPIPFAERRDEIGEMAAAVEVFRQNAIERANLERAAEEGRSASEKERRAREEQKAREAAEVQFAVDELAHGLEALSDGNLEMRLERTFAAHLDKLRENFNASSSKLQKALREVGDNARNIDAGAREILSAANDLSKRTEQQAASVEETAAALEEVTTAVKDSSHRAEEAGQLVAQARDSAERSGEIVSRAIDAMSQIDRSSGEIANIIGVIDEIAFQTNLLALNAGVEAARAGEAGKGFAVVAMEVRELAQRSAKAAKEIKSLISASGDHVRTGVDLVSKTGAALNEIVTQVQQINRNVGAIVTSAREQSTGLAEINVAVNQMDQGTQQNAAMVEQSTAASHGLAEQVTSLNALLAQFRLGQDARSAIQSAGAATAPAPSPARALGRRIASAFGGSATARKQEEWSEF